MKTVHLTHLVLPSLLAGLGGGCAHTHLPVPDQFVELDENRWSGYRQRLTTASGIVVAVREIENDPYGGSAFWLQAIRDRLVQAGGYALIAEQEITASTGQSGHQLRFGHDQGRSQHFYWVSVFVTEEHITIVEAGGQRERFAQIEPELESLIAEVQIR